MSAEYEAHILRHQGKSLFEISRRTGLSEESLKRLFEPKAEPESEPISSTKAIDALILHNQGYSDSDISRKTGIDLEALGELFKAVKRRLKDAGIRTEGDLRTAF